MRPRSPTGAPKTTPAPPPTPSPAEVGTRERLLAAAEDAFAAHGLRGARVQEIVSRAGVNERMLYHYFGDKEGIYRAVLDRFVRDISTHAAEVLEAPTPRAPADRLRDVLELYFDTLASRPNIIRVFLHEALAGWPSQPDLERMQRDVDAELSKKAFDFLGDAARAGAFRRGVDPRVALLVAGATFAFLPVALPRVQRLFDGDLRDPRNLAAARDAIIDVLLHGLLAPAPRRRRRTRR